MDTWNHAGYIQVVIQVEHTEAALPALSGLPEHTEAALSALPGPPGQPAPMRIEVAVRMRAAVMLPSYKMELPSVAILEY